MTDLIKLTGKEIAVAHIELTLYDIAKRFKRDHSKMIKSFEEDVNKLTPAERTSLNFGEMIIDTKRGKGAKVKIATYTMNVKTAVWFAARFDASLRLKIVDYAFKQLEKDYYKLEKKIQKLEADKFIEYDDGYHSMSRIVKKNFPELTTTQVFDMLEELGYITTKSVTTVIRKPVNLDIRTVGEKVIKYNEDEIIEIVTKELL
jgi:hypothetical protein